MVGCHSLFAFIFILQLILLPIVFNEIASNEQIQFGLNDEGFGAKTI